MDAKNASKISINIEENSNLNINLEGRKYNFFRY